MSGVLACSRGFALDKMLLREWNTMDRGLISGRTVACNEENGALFYGILPRTVWNGMQRSICRAKSKNIS